MGNDQRTTGRFSGRTTDHGPRTTPTLTTAPQATAVCPRCENTVYSDRLTLSRYRIARDGSHRPTLLTILCPTCKSVTKVKLEIN